MASDAAALQVEDGIANTNGYRRMTDISDGFLEVQSSEKDIATNLTTKQENTVPLGFEQPCVEGA